MANPTVFGLHQNDLNEILGVLKTHPKVTRVRLFGSRALAKFKEGSDIDIAIDAPDLTHKEYLGICGKLDDLLLPYKIDLLHLDKNENTELYAHVARVGIEL